MTLSKNKKSLGALALALAVTASLSVSAFAQSTTSAPMKGASIPAAKLVPSSSSVPMTDIAPGAVTVRMNEINGNEGILITALEPGAATTVEVRINEATGNMQISEDGGKTWKEYDGRAIAMTPAQPAQQAK